MSKKRESKVYFDDRQTDYLIEWSMKSAQVLATELNSLFDERYKAEDIAAKRAEMKLPLPDRAKSLAAALLPNISTQKQADRPLSAAKMLHPTKPKKKEPEIKEKFRDVSDEMQTKVAELLSGKNTAGNFIIKPVTAASLVVGQKYVYPGKGPVEYLGETVVPVAGMEMKRVSFIEIHTPGQKGIHRLDPARMAEKNIRELATPEMMDDLVYKIAMGQGRLKALPKQGHKQKVFYDGVIASANLDDLANLLCHSFKGDNPLGRRGSFETSYGNAALHLVAAEYAIVKGASYGEAMDLVKHVAGKPTIDQLSRYNDGRMGGGPA